MEGTRLGPYEIRDRLGAGGMGEVWLAEDTRLRRQVAVKVLPAEFAADPERLARFKQEAQAAAALNHPNIAAVFDVGSDGSTHYFVQELLSGTTLKQRLEAGTPARELALQIGVGIARALTAAHRAGVVHRDLKPENVFVGEEGEPKVLDFGLAKITEAETSHDAAESPTQLGTMAGAIIGTVGYMAPEQVEGRSVDGRTDIFAFGCVLYELFSGQRAFAGDSVVQTLNRIVHEPVRPLAAIADVPAELQRIVGKCLAKSPGRRYQTAADLAVDLEALAPEIAGDAAAAALLPGDPREAEAPGRGVAAGVLVAAMLGALLVGGLIGRLTGTAPAPDSVPSFVNLVEAIAPRNDPGVAMAPDGRTIAFIGADEDGLPGLFVRSLDQPDARRIPGTQEPHSPFLSPDGRWLGYYEDGDRSLRKVALATGEIRVLSDSTGGHRGATWTDAGHVVFAAYQGGLGAVAADGGEARVLVPAAADGSAYRFPRFLPGGDDVLVTVQGPADRAGTERLSIAVVSFADGTLRTVLEGASDPRFLEPDLLLFRRQDALFVVRFDAGARQVLGEPAPLVRGVAATSDGPLFYDVARSGTLVYLRADEYPQRDQRVVVAADRQGRLTPVISTRDAYTVLRASPDGGRLAVQVGMPEVGVSSVWIHDLAAGTRAPLLVGSPFGPTWSRDGDWVAVTVESSWNRWAVQMYRSDLSGAMREIDVSGVFAPSPIDFDRDDARFLLQDLTRREQAWAVAVDGGAAPEVVAEGPVQLGATLSRDGRWLAYTATAGGSSDVYVHEIATGRRWSASREGGEAVRWRSDGAELFYWNGDALYAVRRDPTAEGWVAGPAQRLLEGSFVVPSESVPAYDVSPDGETIYLIRDEGPPGAAPTRLELVLDTAALAAGALEAAR